MATRIYSLAKDLGLDNKELVEIVKKAGIAGKGSALASLEDDEVERIRHFMAEGDNQASDQAYEGQVNPLPYRRSDALGSTSTGVLGDEGIDVLGHAHEEADKNEIAHASWIGRGQRIGRIPGEEDAIDEML